MSTLYKKKRHCCDQSGMSHIEWILLIALITIAALVAITYIGSSAKNKMDDVSNTLAPYDSSGVSIPRSTDEGAPLPEPITQEPQKTNAGTTSQLKKTPSFDSYFESAVTGKVTAVSIAIKPVDTAGQNITDISLDTNSARGPLSAVPPYASDLNLNETGSNASDWKCAPQGTQFSCQGKTPLAAGKKTTLVLYFNDMLSQTPQFLTVKIGSINVGVEQKR